VSGQERLLYNPFQRCVVPSNLSFRAQREARSVESRLRGGTTRGFTPIVQQPQETGPYVGRVWLPHQRKKATPGARRAFGAETAAPPHMS